MKQKITIDLRLAKNYPATVYSTNDFVFSYRKLEYKNCYRSHYHNNYELEFLIDGCLESHINSTKYTCKAGSYWLVLPNNFHRIKIISEYATILSIKFTEKCILPEIILKLQKFMSGTFSVMPTEELDAIYSDIDSAFLSLTNMKSDCYRDIIIKCLLSQILAKILDRDYIEYNPTNSERSFPDSLYNSIKYIKDNFTQKLSRDEIAEKFGFSCSYYSAIFKECTGKSFTDFVLGEKLAYAYYLLVSTSMSIKEIAEDSGFESPAYFSKAFKKAYGQSPISIRGQNISQ